MKSFITYMGYQKLTVCYKEGSLQCTIVLTKLLSIPHPTFSLINNGRSFITSKGEDMGNSSAIVDISGKLDLFVNLKRSY